MNRAQQYASALADLATNLAEGTRELVKVLATPAGTQAFDDAELFKVIHGMTDRISPEQFAAIKRAIAIGLGLEVAPLPAPKIGLSIADFTKAAARLGWSLPQIRAVDITESAGGGYFTDIRSEILALDGEGGFIDGSHLLKILYEAHVFARNCSPKGKFNASHPNLSSAKWNRSLYVGGQGEYARLWKAVQLDREAAFKAISVGRYQILGENHKLAGFGTAEAFYTAMAVSEKAQLEAFVTFIVNSGLIDEGRRISDDPETCRAFASGYNGSGYAANNYHTKIADNHRRFREAA